MDAYSLPALALTQPLTPSWENDSSKSELANCASRADDGTSGTNHSRTSLHRKGSSSLSSASTVSRRRTKPAPLVEKLNAVDSSSDLGTALPC